MKKVKILIADAEKNIRGRIDFPHLHPPGWKFVETTECQKVMELAKESQPDLIVLGTLVLPEGSLEEVVKAGKQGQEIEVLKDLKKDPGTRGIPVVIVSRGAQDADVFRGWGAGADIYLTRPFDPNQLAAMIKRVLKALKE